MAKKKIKKKVKRNTKTKGKKLRLSIGVTVLLLVVLAYVGVSFYFTEHFFMNTEINGHDFSGKTVEEADEILAEQTKGYSLMIIDQDEERESISGEEISLIYMKNEEIDKILKGQNIFTWPKSFFIKNSVDVTIGVSYDEAKLEQKISSLHVVTQEQIPAESAYPEFDGDQFVIRSETFGSSIDLEVMKEVVASAINQLRPEIDLKQEKCYEEPKYTSESEEVIKACDEMNKLCQASITYTMDEAVVIEKTMISGWLTVDEEMDVILDESAIQKWLDDFGEKYDTQGTERTFTTPTGKSATVSGGTYGWSINEEKELETIINTINAGEVLTKEPEYYIGGTAAVHAMPDWGNTYAEVDLTQQHMWYVVDGSVVLETDVVTGEPIPERITPEGVYTILEKSLNTTLVGETDASTGKPEYETPVNYWMRVTWSGVGFHDAIWQAAFGGTLNQIHGIGSHGCINMPLDQAQNLYNMIETGTPVVIHY